VETTNTNLNENAVHGAQEQQPPQTSENLLPVIALFIANTISSVGNALTFLAIPWFVLQTTGSYTLMGLTAFVSALSTIISTFFGSLFVDRLGYKRASVVSDCAIGHHLPRRLTFGLCFMLLGLRFWSMAFYLPLWALIGIFALAGLAAGPLNPLILTVQQRLIPAEIRARILSIVSTGYMAGTPLGGLLGGALITWIGLTPSLFLIAVCYLLATSRLLVNPGLKSLDQ
jgi:MFS family permease